RRNRSSSVMVVKQTVVGLPVGPGVSRQATTVCFCTSRPQPCGYTTSLSSSCSGGAVAGAAAQRDAALRATRRAGATDGGASRSAQGTLFHGLGSTRPWATMRRRLRCPYTTTPSAPLEACLHFHGWWCSPETCATFHYAGTRVDWQYAN